MHIINVHYKVTLEELDKFIPTHREYLGRLYKKGLLLCSGPLNPRTGGVIISLTKTKEQVDAIIEKDPFYTNNVAEYSYIEFDPVLRHTILEDLLNS